MTDSSQGADAHRPYQEPVARLLDYGECHMAGGGAPELAWPNYVNELGLTPEHVPELIRLACDATLQHSTPPMERASRSGRRHMRGALSANCGRWRRWSRYLIS